MFNFVRATFADGEDFVSDAPESIAIEIDRAISALPRMTAEIDMSESIPPRGAKKNMLDTFDCPDPSAMAPKRAVTTTPLQALTLLYNPFVLKTAGQFAARVKADAGNEIRKQIQSVYLLAYGRDADADELADATAFIRSNDLAAFCRVVFNSNEFLYVQ